MSKINRFFKSKPVGFIIISACVVIVLVLVASLLFATFSSFKSGITGAVNTQTRELSTQIVYNYENYIGSIIATSNIIQSDADRFVIDTVGDRERLAEYFRDIIQLKSDISKISIYDYETARCLVSSDADEMGAGELSAAEPGAGAREPSDGAREPSAGAREPSADVAGAVLNGGGSDWYYEAINDPTVHVFSVPYSDIDSEEYKVNVSKRVKLQNGGGIGVLKIEISFQSFIDLVDKSNLGEGGHITIIDPKYEIVYTSMPDIESAQAEIGVVRDIVLGSQSAVLGSYNMSVNVDTLSNTKWRICVFINIDRLMEIERAFLLTTALVSCAALIIGVLLFAAVAKTITTPMKQLESAMRKVEQSDYFRMEEVGLVASKEVEALTRRFNMMMKKIGELMEHVIDEQNAQRMSELKALQNQINPHFLYNTLDSIMWLIENAKNKEAGELLVALAKLFRIGISNDSEVITLRDEIEHVRNYLLIQNIRYSDSFDYAFEVDESALDAMTLKLILQPVVENCIYHGLKNKIEKGRIVISAQIEGGSLLLRVADNGYGMRQETIAALYESFGDNAVSNNVGLKNIYQRVMIYYRGNAGMEIESELDEGTTITIREPLIKNDD